MRKLINIWGLSISCAFLMVMSGCSSIPKNAQPVHDFNVNKYLGTWYEIARLDFHFEKNMNNTVAQYSLNTKGNLIVLNSGFNVKDNKWKQVEGTAKFRGDNKIGALKVSFFGPFYAGYNVLALSNNYQYALVAGKSLDYLWILSRTKHIPEKVKAEFLQIAKGLGYEVSKLIWVSHDKNDNPYLNEK